ncbi:MAG: alpha/beta hydrolase [Acetobacteraceae bacterium]|nr:alpha/beta hydrolase [Acetobacteraceae bacterium]
MRSRRAILFIFVAFLVGILPALAAHAVAPKDRYFAASDGVRLHYLEAGPANGQTIILVPGWTMPAWIFDRQIADLSAQYHVIAFDPRSQGGSDIAPTGHDQIRRGKDIAELVARFGTGQVVLVGWSLGVLDTLAYVHQAGDSRLAGLVLIDNSIGEEPPPPAPKPRQPGPKLTWKQEMTGFVHSMFARKQPQAWLDSLTEACLKTPEPIARALLNYAVPRSFWKTAVYSTNKPVLYIVRSKFAGQAGNLAANHPNAETVVLRDAGHAMFVDDPAGFNQRLRDYLPRRVWPPARASAG